MALQFRYSTTVRNTTAAIRIVYTVTIKLFRLTKEICLIEHISVVLSKHMQSVAPALTLILPQVEFRAKPVWEERTHACAGKIADTCTVNEHPYISTCMYTCSYNVSRARVNV